LYKTKYLTFEMDSSGFNNMRLGLENIMLLAHAMGRTLVMPPKWRLTHGMLDKNSGTVVSFSNFYDIAAINVKQNGLNIISMEDFLEREALNGNLKSVVDGSPQYPPENKVKWDNSPLDPLFCTLLTLQRALSGIQTTACWLFLLLVPMSNYSSP
jgi:hypothetical protein